MITFFGALLGFFSALFPEAMKMYRDSMDKKHELAILDRQLQQQAAGHEQRMQAIEAQADISYGQALYQTYHSGVRWVDALNGTVRPVLAYAFFLIYVYVKIIQAAHTPWLIWGEDDKAIFAGIISFYYGQRAMRKYHAARG